MSPTKLRASIIAERIAWVNQMVASVRTLPLDSFEVFTADLRNPASAESFIRRALEALLDLGRHFLAKGYGRAAAEYKEIAKLLHEVGVLPKDEADLLYQMAGFRNRITHFYNEITLEELYRVCTKNLSDIERILSVLQKWIADHPDQIDYEV
ncbi:MAG: DUF86 domain-containing protein [Anaerolineales bacterium]